MPINIYSSALQLPKGPSIARPKPPSAGMMYFNTDKDDIEKYDPITGNWVGMTKKTYRYWRYVAGSAVISHHPRISRIVLKSEGGQLTTIVTFTSDNCSDSGTIPNNGDTYTYDFGSANPQRIIKVMTYSVYGAGARASNYQLQYSNDNSTWYTYFEGITHNLSSYSSGSSTCGLLESTGGYTA